MRSAPLLLPSLVLTLSVALPAFGQPGQLRGSVTDPNQGVIAGAQVSLSNRQTRVSATRTTDAQGAYLFAPVEPGIYDIEVKATGFQPASSTAVEIAAGADAVRNFSLRLEPKSEAITVTAGTVENAYRVERVSPGGPLGDVPVVDLPYTVNVIPRQLIDDTQSRNFKEAAKYMPLVSFQEMQGPEVLRPETRGLQGSNMQNDRKDGMGIAVTTPSAMEEYEQVEILSGVGGPLYGPANPSGMFNFVTKRPTPEPLREFELEYEGHSVATFHTDLAGRAGPRNMFGYRTNLVLGDGNGYVTGSQLRRQLAAGAGDIRITRNTVLEGNYSYYNLYQHGYPGWFSYTPTLSASTNILLPVDAPDPTRAGYGQSFSGVDLTSKIGEVRLKQDFTRDWRLVIGVLDQAADRNINTAVNSLIDNNGDYRTYFANTFQPTLAPRFHVDSDLGYLSGRFHTGKISHEVVIGSTGYRFATYNPVLPANVAGTPFAKTALCTSDTPPVCQANIDDPLVFVIPPTGIPSYRHTIPASGIFVASVIHQQGISLSDNIVFGRHWLARLGASQDWTWTNNYNDSAATGFVRVKGTGNYSSQAVSPTASLTYKPTDRMSIYGTFASSVQAPDVASSGTNVGQALPPYRSKEGELGYKLTFPRVTFTTAAFRVERPFANLNPADNLFEITGNQVNYGIEAMLSGRIIPSLMITGGMTALDPKLTNTGIAATNDKQFVGIPNYKSNILAEYNLPGLAGSFFSFDWQHVGRRPIDDVNHTWTREYNLFDMGIRYSAKLIGKVTTWRIAVSNITGVRYWSTIGPGSITGQSSGSYLGHLGEPRLLTASMRFAF
ncbi:MAG: TonB-dependent receptor [Acidobacteriia bacterium]|nr:TonB-dependent receptor [Terriglobia bacterium]